MEEEVRVCDCCGGEIADGEETIVENDVLCQSCVEDYCIVYDHCGDMIYTENCITDDHIWLCQECYDDYYYRCNSCDRIIHDNEANWYGDLPYCDRCYDDFENDEYDDIDFSDRSYDSDIFAVKLSDGQTGYCSVMGELGECIALALYIGDEGFRSLSTVMNADYNPDPLAVLISQNCLQFELTNKSDMPDAVAESVKKYSKEHNINLKGKNTYPYFPKFQSYYAPWIIIEQTDFQYMLEAVRAAHEVSEKLKGNDKISLGFEISNSKMPLLTPTDKRNFLKYIIYNL